MVAIVRAFEAVCDVAAAAEVEDDALRAYDVWAAVAEIADWVDVADFRSAEFALKAARKLEKNGLLVGMLDIVTRNTFSFPLDSRAAVTCGWGHYLPTPSRLDDSTSFASLQPPFSDVRTGLPEEKHVRVYREEYRRKSRLNR